LREKTALVNCQVSHRYKNKKLFVKEVVHFKKKIADNLLTPRSFKMIQDRKEIKVFDENIPGFSP